MTSSRRQFVSSSALMIAFSQARLLGGQVGSERGSDPNIDSRVVNFWANQVRKPYEDFVQGNGAKGGHFPAPEEPILLMLNQDGSLQLANTTRSDALPDSGSPDVLLSVRRFRPSDTDKKALQDFETGSLRVDFKQVTNQPGIPEALAWSAMSSILAGKNKQLPDFPKLDFNPGTAWANFRRSTYPTELASGRGSFSSNVGKAYGDPIGDS